MRILITTGVYPPEIGGPAYYAVGLEKAFTKAGHEVRVLHYGALKKLPTGIRHILFAFKIFVPAIWSDEIITLDTFSVGIPTVLVSLIARTPVSTRIGGDFLWEQYVQKTGEMIPLPDFYKSDRALTIRYKMIFKLTRFVLTHSTVVFSTHWLREIWQEAYRLNKQDLYVIENAIGEKLPNVQPKEKNFLFFARDIVLKNGESFRKAFNKVKEKYPDIALEEGTVPKEELMERMKSCYAVVLPSLSDVSPNYILDAIRYGKPFLITKHSGFTDWIGEYGLLVDPLDVDDMAEKIEMLADGKSYKKYQKMVESFENVRTYDDIAADFLSFMEVYRGDGIRVLSIGSDKSLFEEGSPAQLRQEKYGKLFEELHIIVFTKRSDNFEIQNIAPNVWVHPTNSFSRWSYVFGAIRIGRKFDCDIVSTQDPFESGLAGAFIYKKLGARLHVQVHTDIMSSEFVHANFLNRIRRVIASWVIPKANCIRSVSRKIERGIEVRYRPLANISILPIFVDLKEFENLERKKHERFETTLLVVSRLEKEKNVELAIRALYKARRAGNNAGLVIVGSGREEGKLKNLAEELDIVDWVEFVGWQDPKEYYSMADLVLFPSHYDGYGMVIVEALAVGVPVLSTDVGIAHEAGAIVAKEEGFGSALVEWFKNGQREGKLLYKPYKNEKEYLELYKQDIEQCL